MEIELKNIKCINKGCSNTFAFRKNKKFCSNKCRNFFHNKAASMELSANDGLLKKMQKASKVLGRLMKKMEQLKIDSITPLALKLFDIPVDGFLEIEKNTSTNATIRWYGAYGIEAISNSPLQYCIHKRD